MLTTFLNSFADVPWLANAGKPRSDAVIVPDVVTGWDDWNSQMMETWFPQTHALESLARDIIGEPEIERIFSAVSTRIDEPVRNALQRYFDNRPNINENTDC